MPEPSPLVASSALLPTNDAASFVGSVLPWLIAGGLIGLVTGLRWAGANPLRAVHALLGGLLGGTLSGLLVTVLPKHEFLQALSYMLTGTGITLTYSIVPDGTLMGSGNGEDNTGSVFQSDLNAIYGSKANLQRFFGRSALRVDAHRRYVHISLGCRDRGRFPFNSATQPPNSL